MPHLAAALHWCTPYGGSILDPFAGTGRIHEFESLTTAYQTVGVELEPEWAGMHERTVVGDATALPFAAATFDTVCTSPCYGNRMADHHDARDASKRNTYTHVLGRKLHARNMGAMQWGHMYRAFHWAAWAEASRVLKPSGALVLNISNHIRKGVEQKVYEWHIDTLEALGFRLRRSEAVSTPRQRQGANGALRCEHEYVAVFAAPTVNYQDRREVEQCRDPRGV
jgi:tRNA G10  N-methylase Trm11